MGEVKRIMKEHNFDRLPNQTKLGELGYRSLGYAINQRFGGFRNLRRILGESKIKEDSEDIKNFEYVLNMAKKAMEEQGWDELPSKHTIEKKGYSPLVTAIQRYHEGLVSFREKLNEHLGKQSEQDQLKTLLENYTT